MNETGRQFTFKEFDLEGLETLESISAAPAFNEWMYDTISKNLQGEILEIGSGIGNISEYFIRDGKSITLSDIRENYLNYLRHRFEGESIVKDIMSLDAVAPNFDTRFKEYFGKFDGIFALNVVEHIEDDTLALENMAKLLKPGGRMVILVPAHQWLYNEFDKSLEHYRRYSKPMLVKCFKDAGLEPKHSQFFNMAGIPGWFLSGSVLKKKIISTSQMKLYNSLVPLFKICEGITGYNIGLSVIVEGIKKED